MAGQDWNVTTEPPTHLKVSLIPQKIRDLKSATKTIIQKEHVALGTSNSGGQHLKGAARVYLSNSLPGSDPEGNNLDTSATSDNGRLAVATGGGASTGLTNTIKVYVATSAGISTSWKDVRAAYAGTAVRVSLGSGINVVGQHNTGAETYINLIKVNANDVPEILVGAVMSADTAPSTGVGISNKKYVDAHGIVQVVNVQDGTYASCATAMPFDNTIPENSEGNEVMTLEITPTSATNKLKIEVVVNAHAQTYNTGGVALFQDSTVNALAVAMFGSGGAEASNFTGTVVFTHYMTAGTTSATTFKIRLGAASGGAGFNGKTGAVFGGVIASSITITELGG